MTRTLAAISVLAAVQAACTVERFLKDAQSSYIARNYNESILMARVYILRGGDRERALRLIGACWCQFRDRVEALAIWRQLSNPPGREYLRYVCGRNGLLLLAPPEPAAVSASH
jgi:hypothetical protein